MLKYRLPSSFRKVLFTARGAFSARSWPYVLTLAAPWILLGGQRCMTRLMQLASYRRSLSAYYRFLSEGKWRLDVLFRGLFLLIVKTFSLQHELCIAVDDTLVPKWGRRIFGTAYYYDHVKRPQAGVIWGHNWIVLAVVVPFGSKGQIALPFWLSLHRTEKVCGRREYRTRCERAKEAICAVQGWYSGRIVIVGDGSYTTREVVSSLGRENVHLVGRIKNNARLHGPTPPPRKPGQRGRPRKYGNRLPTPQKLAGTRSCFQPLRVEIYGKEVDLLVREKRVYWWALKRVVKLVITRDPKRPRLRAYLITTDLEMSARETIEAFSKRWPIEQLFSILKNQLGFDSAEIRTKHSVIRHAALTMAFATWTTVWIQKHRRARRGATFARQLRVLREAAVKETIFASGPRTQGSRRIATGMAELFSTATLAA